MLVKETIGYKTILSWMEAEDRKPFLFQEEAWEYIRQGRSGLVNAPTGCGKTFSVFLGALIDFINRHPNDFRTRSGNGLQLLWISPLRALAKDIGRAMDQVIRELGMHWQIGTRNGDTDPAERQRQKRKMPEVLITTPESLHLLLAQKGYADVFKPLKIVAVDEWHELLGSKRGVQVELALSRILGTRNGTGCSIIGISATIGNLEQAKEVLLASLSGGAAVGPDGASAVGPDGASTVGPDGASAEKVGGASAEKAGGASAIGAGEASAEKAGGASAVGAGEASAVEAGGASAEKAGGASAGMVDQGFIVRAVIHKPIDVESILPDEIEKYPWAGHLGLRLIHKVIPIIESSRTTLIFINTRGMSETWYQSLLNICPDLAGAIALHHGSIDLELRNWVEESLHEGKLKAVVCTASLDLGVDFRPVETVIQVGSPKGVARFLQRAGRSGHQPGQVSKIWFLPTHSLELMEAAALKSAMQEGLIESREPMLLCFDVLIQYLSTLAIAEGFYPEELFRELKKTYCYQEMAEEEWREILHFITQGGVALQQYDEYRKVEIMEGGLYKINSRRVAMRHRLHIGTIVSEPMLKVRFSSGGYVGVIEEYFISRLEPGETFTLAGRNLELVMIKDMTVLVRKSNAKKSRVPSWNGGRMPLSANLGMMLRRKLDEATRMMLGEAVGPHRNRSRADEVAIVGGGKEDIELRVLQPLFELQAALSYMPRENELLIEQIETKDGFHLFVYPFEGRLVHEAMAALLAYRISRITPISFSFAMNDYGFELLSDQPIPVDDSNVYELFSPDNLTADIQRSVNSAEMARRKFRDIAVIGGLIFQGYPGEYAKARHLQSSAGLLFNVFAEYDPHNLLIRQAYNEVMDQQMEERRLRNMLERVSRGKMVLRWPRQLTPFCFPLKVDSMREDLSSEKLEDRVRRMQAQLR